MSDKIKTNSSGSTNIIIGIFLILCGIFNIVLAEEFVKYKKSVDERSEGCIDKSNPSAYNTMDKINALKQQQGVDNNTVSGEPEYRDDNYSANLTISIILIIGSLLLITAGVFSMQGKDNLSFLNEDSSRKYLFIIIGLFGISASITTGTLIQKYKDYRYTQERVIAGCTKLEDINSEEDITAAFERRTNLPEEGPTPMTHLNTALAVLLGLSSLFFLINGSKSFKGKSTKVAPNQNQNTGPVVNITLAAPTAPVAAPVATSSKIFTPAY